MKGSQRPSSSETCQVSLRESGAGSHGPGAESQVTASLQSLKTLTVRGCKLLSMAAVRSIIINTPYLEVSAPPLTLTLTLTLTLMHRLATQ
jgi:hypothetical protein